MIREVLDGFDWEAFAVGVADKSPPIDSISSKAAEFNHGETVDPFSPFGDQILDSIPGAQSVATFEAGGPERSTPIETKTTTVAQESIAESATDIVVVQEPVLPSSVHKMTPDFTASKVELSAPVLPWRHLAINTKISSFFQDAPALESGSAHQVFDIMSIWRGEATACLCDLPFVLTSFMIDSVASCVGLAWKFAFDPGICSECLLMWLSVVGLCNAKQLNLPGRTVVSFVFDPGGRRGAALTLLPFVWGL